MSNRPFILLTIDVEDWFQVENFKQWIPYSTWDDHELRVERNVHRILDLLDVSSRNPSDPALPWDQERESCHRRPLRATFFFLGWVAERLPHLVREVHARGHEIASHGYAHKLCPVQSLDELQEDLKKSKSIIENVLGQAVIGYRAPSFSINNRILKVIHDCGYHYDSSYNSFAMHGRYGKLSAPHLEKKGIASRLFDEFWEIPISNLKLGRQVMPWGGGAYFRLIPFYLFRLGIHSIIKKEAAYVFYMHPWELDPEQPKLSKVRRTLKFRHYVNISRCQDKLSRLIQTFCSCDFISCRDFLDRQIGNAGDGSASS